MGADIVALRRVRDALDRGGYDPRGPDHDFRSRCPAHNGDSRSALHVKEGADGRALLWCFVGCETEEVLAALELSWLDLFPPEHFHARQPRGFGRPVPMSVRLLEQLRRHRIGYKPAADPSLWLADTCPACRDAHLLLHEDECGRVTLSCFNACPQPEIALALLGAEVTR